ncbi:MAG: ATP-dependent Clp protease ATP-binding subunit [Bacteroidales bacterium]|nr:ATP-dependent Clp protease ATP-binding subunit [Bacteroidales bacterium]
MKAEERSLDIFTDDVVEVIVAARGYASSMRHEFVTLEHVAYAMVSLVKNTADIFATLGIAKVEKIKRSLLSHLAQMEVVPPFVPDYELEESLNFVAVMDIISKRVKMEKKEGEKVSLAMFMGVFVQFNPSMCFASKVFQSVIKEDMPSFMVKLLTESISIEPKDLVEDIVNQMMTVATGGEGKGLRGEVRVLKGPAALEMLKKELQNGGIIKRGGDENSDEEGSWDASNVQQLRVDVLYPFDAKEKRKHKTYCREYELDKIVTTLMRCDRSNVILVGESGVGKTQMGYAIMQLINSKECPEYLAGGAIFELNLAGLTAGVQIKAEVDARMSAAMAPFTNEKAPKDKHVIIFIDDIHGFVGGMRQGNESLDIFSVLKPFAEVKNLHFVIAASYEDYNKLQGSNKVVDKLFQKIEIKEPSAEDTKLIVSKVIATYAKYHNVSYPTNIINEAVELAERHIGEQFFPAKVIDLLDEAGAMMRAERAKQSKDSKTSKLRVTNECLQKAIAIRTHKEKGASRAGKSTAEKYSQLLDEMQSKIYGQDTALNEVVNSVLMGQAGLEDETKPLASLFFVGPTGVGKTEVAKELANQLEVPLIRFDMSEFAEAHTVAKLIGSPAGYVGYDEGGLLTNAVRKSPSAVVLFDEIEKAHKDIYNILLQVMDYASLTDNKGVKASFRNTIIIFTSNAGAQFAKQASLGFGSKVTAGDAMMTEVKKVFKPEFINRLSRIVVFNGMDKKMASLILDSRIKKLTEQVAKKGVSIEFTEAAKEWLLAKGYTPEYGAREMDRVISQHVKSTLSKAMLFGSLSKKGAKAKVDVEGDAIVIL